MNFSYPAAGYITGMSVYKSAKNAFGKYVYSNIEYPTSLLLLGQKCSVENLVMSPGWCSTP
jgi:hypothetical protein